MSCAYNILLYQIYTSAAVLRVYACVRVGYDDRDGTATHGAIFNILSLGSVPISRIAYPSKVLELHPKIFFDIFWPQLNSSGVQYIQTRDETTSLMALL